MLADKSSRGSTSAGRDRDKSEASATDLSNFIRATDDFRTIGIQIFKYSVQCIEEPKLFYTIFIRVAPV